VNKKTSETKTCYSFLYINGMLKGEKGLLASLLGKTSYRAVNRELRSYCVLL